MLPILMPRIHDPIFIEIDCGLKNYNIRGLTKIERC